MEKIVILGAGNVAYHLTRAFKEKGIAPIQIYNRDLEHARALAQEQHIPYTNDITHLLPADLYIIAASDHAIAKIAAEIPHKEAIVAHTSGTTPLNEIPEPFRKGVFYQLQTFSKERKDMDYSAIPFLISGSDTSTEKRLYELAHKLSDKVWIASDEQRKNAHLAAVWTCNFVNHLYYQAQKICETQNIPFELLQPLIRETAKKVRHLSPKEAQTGPALRNDVKTLQIHEQMLQDPKLKALYQQLTQSIKETYG